MAGAERPGEGEGVSVLGQAGGRRSLAPLEQDTGAEAWSRSCLQWSCPGEFRPRCR